MDSRTIVRIQGWHSQSAAGFARSIESNWLPTAAVRTNIEGTEASPTGIHLPSSLPLIKPQPATLLAQRQQEGIQVPLTINSASGSALSVARQTLPASTPTVETGSAEGTKTFTPMVASAPAQVGEIDLKQLVEQVSRIIFRQLAVERERRGLGRWH
jgi:hypothetical protein